MTATQQKLAHHDFCMTDCGYGKADMGLAKLKRLQWVASSPRWLAATGRRSGGGRDRSVQAESRHQVLAAQ